MLGQIQLVYVRERTLSMKIQDHEIMRCTRIYFLDIVGLNRGKTLFECVVSGKGFVKNVSYDLSESLSQVTGERTMREK